MEREISDATLRWYFDSQERVEITFTYGEKTRCYIGRSVGRVPAWLMVKRRDSLGGYVVTPREIADIRGLGIYR